MLRNLSSVRKVTDKDAARDEPKVTNIAQNKGNLLYNEAKKQYF